MCVRISVFEIGTGTCLMLQHFSNKCSWDRVNELYF